MKIFSLFFCRIILQDNNSILLSLLFYPMIVTIIGGIIVALITTDYGKSFRKYISNFFYTRNTDILQLEQKNTIEDLKKKLRILVIDDDDIFPVNGFKQFGYLIDHWTFIQEAELKRLLDGEFDIIILDIYGIATNIAKEDGLDVLKIIKEHNPSQVIIAYSGQSFDLSKQIFWDLADEKLSKPTHFITTQLLIDRVIKEKFTLKNYISLIKKTLDDYHQNDDAFNKIEKLIIKSLTTSYRPDWKNDLNSLSNDVELKNKISIICNNLIKHIK